MEAKYPSFGTTISAIITDHATACRLQACHHSGSMCHKLVSPSLACCSLWGRKESDMTE